MRNSLSDLVAKKIYFTCAAVERNKTPLSIVQVQKVEIETVDLLRKSNSLALHALHIRQELGVGKGNSPLGPLPDSLAFLGRSLIGQVKLTVDSVTMRGDIKQLTRFLRSDHELPCGERPFRASKRSPVHQKQVELGDENCVACESP